jgi:hypothetical protein
VDATRRNFDDQNPVHQQHDHHLHRRHGLSAGCIEVIDE